MAIKEKRQTMEQKPLILISNDDGYHAKGIRSLIGMVADMGEVVVCAPEAARSGFSRAFSATDPLRLKERKSVGGAPVWSCNGTPVDCVKIAFDQLTGGRKPDLVIGGINHGDNSTVNNHYSGTMGVAIEGCLKGIPSIAFSLCDYGDDADFSPLAGHVRNIVAHTLGHGLPPGVCLNVNFPKADRFKGVKVCRMARGQWVDEVVSERHPRGYGYYWLVGRYVNGEPGAEGTDQKALEDGFVAITPTTIDVTAYGAMDGLKALEHY